MGKLQNILSTCDLKSIQKRARFHFVISQYVKPGRFSEKETSVDNAKNPIFPLSPPGPKSEPEIFASFRTESPRIPRNLIFSYHNNVILLGHEIKLVASSLVRCR